MRAWLQGIATLGVLTDPDDSTEQTRRRGEGDSRGRLDQEAGRDAKKVEETTAPFRHALTTKAGCECVAHILQTLTDSNQETTIISIDGVGAYDLISRNAMLEGLLRMEDGDQILPFVRMFHGSPSTYLWEDEMGVVQHIPPGEGGEQG